MNLIQVSDLEALSIGAAILGAGGGGDPSVEKLITMRQLKETGPVRLIKVEDLKESDVVVPMAYMGAPLVAIERLPSGIEFKKVLEEIEKYTGKKPTVLMSAEIGGANSFASLSVASALNLPVIDADCMGRAFPELQMSSFNIHGHKAAPAFLANYAGNSAIINGHDSPEVERLARGLTVSFGSSAALAFHILSGTEAKKYSVANSMSYAIEIGRCILDAQAQSKNPVEALVNLTQAKILGTGVISDIDQKISDGFLRGVVQIDSIAAQDNSKLVVHYQNENIIVMKGEEVLGTSPDIISIIDAQTGRAITSESLAYGLRVSVALLPCHPIWKTPKGLELVGPKYFGYSMDYMPFEEAVSVDLSAQNELLKG